LEWDEFGDSEQVGVPDESMGRRSEAADMTRST